MLAVGLEFTVLKSYSAGSTLSALNVDERICFLSMVNEVMKHRGQWFVPW